jgi:NAD(P)-dependent dehydrogenase (short-subunit alcohol dehydrogenase family)
MSEGAFAGKVAVVTGGSAGIGLAIARAFAREGARVAIAGRGKTGLERAASEIEDEIGAKVLPIPADVALPNDCERIVTTVVERLEGLDILINNAAHFALVPLAEADAVEAERFFAINVLGPMNCARAFAAYAFDSGRSGAIVNISSIAGARPAPGCGLYSASKAALESLTRSMALEWGPRGLRVNAVSPGHVNTEGVLADLRAGRIDEAALLKSIPARRIADVEDVADSVLFLCSDKARHIMGQALTVDGGEGF